MELEFTSGHVGGFNVGGFQGALSKVYIDYFRNSIRLVYQDRNGSSLVFDGQANGDTLTGTMNSSLKSRTGTFTVTKVPDTQSTESVIGVH